jgi:hypothetical protein
MAHVALALRLRWLLSGLCFLVFQTTPSSQVGLPLPRELGYCLLTSPTAASFLSRFALSAFVMSLLQIPPPESFLPPAHAVPSLLILVQRGSLFPHGVHSSDFLPRHSLASSVSQIAPSCFYISFLMAWTFPPSIHVRSQAAPITLYRIPMLSMCSFLNSWSKSLLLWLSECSLPSS